MKKHFIELLTLITCLLAIMAVVSCSESSVVPEPPAPPEPEAPIIIPEGCSGTLPILYINNKDTAAIDSKEVYRTAEWWLDAIGLPGVESIGSKDKPLGMLIKGRGNATWTDVEKKSYRLKFDEKHKVLGMPSSRHWVLMAQAQYWMGQMNDALAFEIGRRMGMSWNPHMEPVEVMLDDEYLGLYFITEKIRVAKHRVNVIEQEDYETDPYKITGGWLLEFDNYSDSNTISLTEGDGKPLRLTPHSPELLSIEQLDYITKFFIEADSAIYLEDKQSRLWEEYIDIDSLAIYYIVQEVIDNPEAFSGSCFMHKQRGSGTKLVFGPFWDCGSSFVRYNGTYQFNDFIYENMPEYCQSRWIHEIVKFPRFQERVRYHWKRFYEKVYPTIESYMDRFAARIETAGNYDYQRWPQYAGDNIPGRVNTFLKPSFHKKVAWLNEQWGNE